MQAHHIVRKGLRTPEVHAVRPVSKSIPDDLECEGMAFVYDQGALSVWAPRRWMCGPRLMTVAREGYKCPEPQVEL